MADDDVEVMVDALLSGGMTRIRLARNLVTFARQLAWTIIALTVLAGVGLGAAGLSADTNGAQLIGLALYTILGGLVLAVVLLSLAALVDLAAARFELALWQSPLFEDDEA